MCRECGQPTVAALTPGGRSIELDLEPVWVPKGGVWPTWIFTLDREADVATPALELERNANDRSGPFHRAHVCEPA
jgi:hypothetical protein